MKERQKLMAAGEKEASAEFLKEAASAEGAVQTESGLIYTEIKAGDGDSPQATDVVKVHYHGTLRDGTVFDSSVERGNPATFPLNRVIPCWTEGVQKMKVGGKSKLVCPSEIAYGDRGSPPKIKPGAALVFEVELLEIVKKEAGTKKPPGHP
jgi:FKBP-type peptidyl-prolyl cis-trans isomerase